MATEPAGHGPSTSLPIGRFTGRKDFEQHVCQALACAVDQGWKDLLLCDFNFEDWPLNTREVQDALDRWARPGRRLTLLAVRYDDMVRRHPRFVVWRRRWDHLLDCRVGRATAPDDFPSVLLSPHWCMQRIDRLRSVCLCHDSQEHVAALRDNLGQRVRDSTPGFPASTLGL